MTQNNVEERLNFVRMAIDLAQIYEEAFGEGSFTRSQLFTDQSSIDVTKMPYGKTEVKQPQIYI